MPAFSRSYNIPVKTPFELEAFEAGDEDHDELTYCWEQWNLGDFEQSWNRTRLYGPTFRSFNPDISTTRVFPTMSKVLAGITDYLGERLPDTNRSLTFKLAVRDVLNGIGSFIFPDDSIRLNATSKAGPFTVLSPGAVTWFGGTTQTVTWDVANTNAPPVNCTAVDIFLSVDGGYTYSFVLAGNTPNDGEEEILVPNFATTHGRIKVKATGNVFFNVNNVDFTISDAGTGVKEVKWEEAVKIYPMPASDNLNITNNYNGKLEMIIINAVGQKIWTGSIVKQLSILVSSWAKGMYYMRLMDVAHDRSIVKPIAIQ